MGASLVYLDEPNKNIEWADGEDSRATFACGEMQGWRLNMVSVIYCFETGRDFCTANQKAALFGVENKVVGSNINADMFAAPIRTLFLQIC